MSTSANPSTLWPKLQRSAQAGLVVAALLLLSRPWLKAGNAALTFSPFDLAEWLTLVPDVRFGANAMTTPFYIRLVHALVFCCVAVLPRQMFSVGWWCAALVGIAGSIALLPPVEFFIRPEMRPDSNYEQLVMVAGLSGFLVVLGLSPLGRRFGQPVAALMMLFVLVWSWQSAQVASGYLTIKAIPHTMTVWLFCGVAAACALAFIAPTLSRILRR
jgi:hypothetical protein